MSFDHFHSHRDIFQIWSLLFVLMEGVVDYGQIPNSGHTSHHPQAEPAVPPRERLQRIWMPDTAASASPPQPPPPPSPPTGALSASARPVLRGNGCFFPFCISPRKVKVDTHTSLDILLLLGQREVIAPTMLASRQREAKREAVPAAGTIDAELVADARGPDSEVERHRFLLSAEAIPEEEVAREVTSGNQG